MKKLKRYQVIFSESYSRTVTVLAESQEQAEELATNIQSGEEPNSKAELISGIELVDWNLSDTFEVKEYKKPNFID